MTWFLLQKPSNHTETFAETKEVVNQSRYHYEFLPPTSLKVFKVKISGQCLDLSSEMCERLQTIPPRSTWTWNKRPKPVSRAARRRGGWRFCRGENWNPRVWWDAGQDPSLISCQNRRQDLAAPPDLHKRSFGCSVLCKRGVGRRKITQQAGAANGRRSTDDGRAAQWLLLPDWFSLAVNQRRRKLLLFFPQSFHFWLWLVCCRSVSHQWIAANYQTTTDKC